MSSSLKPFDRLHNHFIRRFQGKISSIGRDGGIGSILNHPVKKPYSIFVRKNLDKSCFSSLNQYESETPKGMERYKKVEFQKELIYTAKKTPQQLIRTFLK